MFGEPVGLWSPQSQRSLPLGPAAPAGDKAAATRPALSFSLRARLQRLPACLRAAGRAREVPGAAQSFPGRGERVGGPSLQHTPAGRGTRSPAGCPRDGHDLAAAAAVAICHQAARVGEGPGPGVRVPPRRPGRRGPALCGAEPRAEGTLALARQVGGGGAGSAGGRCAARAGAL